MAPRAGEPQERAAGASLQGSRHHAPPTGLVETQGPAARPHVRGPGVRRRSRGWRARDVGRTKKEAESQAAKSTLVAPRRVLRFGHGPDHRAEQAAENVPKARLPRRGLATQGCGAVAERAGAPGARATRCRPRRSGAARASRHEVDLKISYSCSRASSRSPTAARFHLEPGITAVVGPNGSGKSNISDAVLWVLGERNANSGLRGQAMEDVIFAGSSARKASGLAEVELVRRQLTTASRSVGLRRGGHHAAHVPQAARASTSSTDSGGAGDGRAATSCTIPGWAPARIRSSARAACRLHPGIQAWRTAARSSRRPPRSSATKQSASGSERSR